MAGCEDARAVSKPERLQQHAFAFSPVLPHFTNKQEEEQAD